jgi:hypothetical protein
MSISERVKWIILPALLVIGIGILEIQYPNAMQGFDDSYTGRGAAGLILLVIELFLMITWGKIGGMVAITVSIFAVILSFAPNSKQTKEETTEGLETERVKHVDTQAVSSFALRTARMYMQKRLDNRKP